MAECYINILNHMKRVITHLIATSFALFAVMACTPEEAASLAVSTDTVVLNESADSGSFIVIADSPWSVEIPETVSWVRTTPKSGKAGNVTVNVNGDPNPGTSERRAVIAVTAGEARKEVTVIQPGIAVSFDPSEISVAKEGGSVKVTLVDAASHSWSLKYAGADNVTVTPSEGKGMTDLTVTVGENPTNRARSFKITFSTSESSYELGVSQEAGENHSPVPGALISPENGDNDVNRMLTFTWSASTDPDHDNIVYSLEYRAAGGDWVSTEPSKERKYATKESLEANTAYTWRVKTTDEYGAYAYSEEWSFTTNETEMYPDQTCIQYTKDGLTGTIPVIFMGDGFTVDDYVAGGHFDTVIDEGIEAFFSAKPYSTYREHFTAWKVIAYSEEKGASRWSGSDKYHGKYVHKVKTCFDTKYFGDGYSSTYMTTDDDKVFKYAKLVPGIDDEALNKTVVVLVVNDPVYSGTCWQYWEGRGIGIVPLCRTEDIHDWFKDQDITYTAPYSYKATMLHEAAGHGFGRLADEYVYERRPANDEDKKNIGDWWNAPVPCNLNVDYRAKEECHWNMFIGREGYEGVGYISGAQYSGGGLYMSEKTSCMRDMTYYYNVASRLAIVRRIWDNLGYVWDIDRFIEEDLATGANVRPKSVKSAGEWSPATPAHTPPQKVYTK